MCGIGEPGGHPEHEALVSHPKEGLTAVQTSDLLAYARHIVNLPELRTGHVGFVGFGDTKEGDKVLLAVDTQYDPDVVDSVAAALRERGAHVDVLNLDYGPDRKFDYLDEVQATMRHAPWDLNPRRWEGVPWV